MRRMLPRSPQKSPEVPGSPHKAPEFPGIPRQANAADFYTLYSVSQLWTIPYSKDPDPGKKQPFTAKI